LIDSHVEQVNENTFVLQQPDGQITKLVRNGRDPQLLEGGGWKAVIQGDQIIAKAECGWSTTYNRGRISRIVTPENRALEIRRGAKEAEVTYNGKQVIGIERDGDKGRLRVGNKIWSYSLTQRPQVTIEAGRNLVAGTSSSLGAIKSSDGTSREYTFAVDQQLRPTLTTNGVIYIG
jgi:hypothetical protein